MKLRLKALFMLTALFLSMSPVLADIVSKPYTWSPGQTLPANQLNLDFDTIYNDYNGNIKNANIAASAAIQTSKINPNSELFWKLTTGTNAVSVGVTGDTQPRVGLRSDGRLQFGSGSIAPDIAFLRSTSSLLKLRDPGDTVDKDLSVGSFTYTNAFTTPSITQNWVFASPNGAPGSATFRALVAADIPTIGISQGGTGQTTKAAAFDALAPGTPSKGWVIVYNSVTSHWDVLTNAGAGDDGKTLALDSTVSGIGVKWSTSGAGSVTSVSATATPTSIFDINVTNPTSTPAIALTMDNQTGNVVIASPSGGGSGQPAFRTLVVADLPSGITVAKGGTGLSSCAAGDSFFGSGSNTIAALSQPASDYMVWGKRNGLGSGTNMRTQRIARMGGTGEAGDLTVSSNTTETTIKQRNGANQFVINGSVSYSVVSGTVLQSATDDTSNNDFSVGSSSVLSVQTGGLGPAGGAQVGDDGFGYGAGRGSQLGTIGGGGGGYGGIGGNGGAAAATSTYGRGGTSYSTILPCGSTGGAGSWDVAASNGTGGAGGNAGGGMRLTSGANFTIANSGTVTANGFNGAAAGGTPTTAASAGGGGSGGYVGIYALGTISVGTSASITATGGNGGNGVNGAGTGGGGGGGAGGYVVMMAPTITLTGTATAAGGSAGTGGTPTAGGAGVVVNIPSTPNYPLIGYTESQAGWESAKFLKEKHTAAYVEGKGMTIAADEWKETLIAHSHLAPHDATRVAYLLDHGCWDSGDMANVEYSEVLPMRRNKITRAA